MINSSKMLRDVLIEKVHAQMTSRRDIFFVTADFGAPRLDLLRKECQDRFINVGIAEQNLVTIGTGLALEGFTVFLYGIAPFLVMRAYEQIRINVSVLSGLRPMNLNMIGVGTGLSYDVSGPTHHCLEDLGIMRMLPNIDIFSPCDPTLVDPFVEYCLSEKRPKYIRLDGKPVTQVYTEFSVSGIRRGFHELQSGESICIVATGYMTHKAIRVRDLLSRSGLNIGVVDVFMLKHFDSDSLVETLGNYSHIVTLEEGFVGKGGLDAMIMDLIANRGLEARVKNLGFPDRHVFEIGSRESLHGQIGLSEEQIASQIISFVSRQDSCAPGLSLALEA
jgi:transketolase